MDISTLSIQLLNGLASASSLFMVAAGLSLIFGVTRIINFAHGSFYMVGIYLTYTLTHYVDTGVGYWLAVLAAAILTGILGGLVEFFILRRIYKAPELFQLLTTFALVLIFSDAVLWLWGPEDLLGKQVPYMDTSFTIGESLFPTYQLFLIVAGPVILSGLWWLLHRTTFGVFIRAAQQDKVMLGALGVPQARLFTWVFVLGTFLAGLGAGLELPNEPASLSLDLRLIGDAFAVVVIGGMGSIMGAFMAALSIAEVKAIAHWLGTQTLFGVNVNFSELTLISEFLLMALVLIVKPWGLLGKAQEKSRNSSPVDKPLVPIKPYHQLGIMLVFIALLSVPWVDDGYIMLLLQDALVAVLFAVSLHFIAGLAGMHTFGHAVYFGMGAYGAALLHLHLNVSMELSLLFAPFITGGIGIVFGWFCIRLTGIYLAMLTLAFAQLTWSIIFQWDGFTGGSNGLIGVWPSAWLEEPAHYFYFTLCIVAMSIWVMRKITFSSFGYAMRASRDSVRGAQSIGILVRTIQWQTFMISGFFAGLAGALFAFSKGSISPEVLSVEKSIDGLVMVLLGGIQSLAGPIVGALSYTFLHDYIIYLTDYWKALLGIVIILLVVLFPMGLVGLPQQLKKHLIIKGK